MNNYLLHQGYNTFFITKTTRDNKILYYQPLISKLVIRTLTLPFKVWTVFSVNQDRYVLLGNNDTNKIYVYELTDQNQYTFRFIIRSALKEIVWLKGAFLNTLWIANYNSVEIYQSNGVIANYYSIINNHENIKEFEEIDNNAYAATDNGIVYHYFINNNNELRKEIFCVFDGDETSQPIIKLNQHTLYFCFNKHRIYLLNRLYGRIITSFRTEMKIENILINKVANKCFIVVQGIREGNNSLEIYDDCLVQMFKFKFANYHAKVIDIVYSPIREDNYTKYIVKEIIWIKLNHLDQIEVKHKKIKE